MALAITINSPNPLVTRYPRPPEGCPSGKVLYRITFKYKCSRYSGDRVFDITDANFGFKTTGHDKKLVPGALVKYTPKKQKKQTHPNYGQLARITLQTSLPRNRAALSQNRPMIPGSETVMYDIKFINPLMVNNKLVNNKTEVPKSDLTLVPELEVYRCEDSFVPITLINNYIQARDAFRNDPTGTVPPAFAGLYATRQLWLQAMENGLWNNHFILDDNNQPLYPKWWGVGTPFFVAQQNLRQKLNTFIDSLVKIGFIPGKIDQQSRIEGRKNNWRLKFIMPKGASPGQTITVPVNQQQIVVKIPLTLPGPPTTIPQEGQSLTIPILRSNNNSIYDNIKKTKKKNLPDIVFIPTLIEGQFANGKQLDVDKMVKPSKDQQFTITNAEIIKHRDPVHTNDDNFQFKVLPQFDKNLRRGLVFDLQVDVNLTLEQTKKLTKEEKELEAKSPVTTQIWNNVGRGTTSLINNSGANCPGRMTRFKQEGKNFVNAIIPTTPPAIAAATAIANATTTATTAHTNANTQRLANVASGRPGVRSGGRRRKRTKRRRKKRRRKTRRSKRRKQRGKTKKRRRRKKRTKRSRRKIQRGGDWRTDFWFMGEIDN